MSRPFRQARSRKAIARQLIAETAVLLLMLFVIVTAISVFLVPPSAPELPAPLAGSGAVLLDPAARPAAGAHRLPAAGRDVRPTSISASDRSDPIPLEL